MSNYTYKNNGSLTYEGVSLTIEEPNNISRNNGQLAQTQWNDNTHQPAIITNGPGGFSNLMNCMEIDWGNALWNGTDVYIDDLKNGNGIRGVKSSWDVLRLLFWCIKKLNTTTPTPTPTYTVTVNGTNGTVNPTSRTVTSGGTATFTLTPNNGYKLPTSVEGASISGNTLTVSNVTSNKTINVLFPEDTIVPVLHNVTINVINGKIDVSGTPTSTTIQVADNNGTRIRIIPNTGYILPTSINGATIDGQYIVINNVTSDLTINITCTQVQYTVILNITNGTKNPNRSQTVSYGGNVSWTITANAGYELPTSVEGASISGNTLTVSNVTSNTTINVVCRLQSQSSINVLFAYNDRNSNYDAYDNSEAYLNKYQDLMIDYNIFKSNYTVSSANPYIIPNFDNSSNELELFIEKTDVTSSLKSSNKALNANILRITDGIGTIGFKYHKDVTFNDKTYLYFTSLDDVLKSDLYIN